MCGSLSKLAVLERRVRRGHQAPARFGCYLLRLETEREREREREREGESAVLEMRVEQGHQTPG
jgi:hypothetical protein